MRCDRYWREGIVLVERGQPDPHSDGCSDCGRAHAARRALVELLPLVGAGRTGDPHWQAKVWQRIERERSHAARRWSWQLDSALVLACSVAFCIGLRRPRPDEKHAEVEIVRNAAVMRATDPHVGDHLRVMARPGADVWIYRAERLVLQCRAGQLSESCAVDSGGMIVEIELSTPATYHVIVVDNMASRPRGTLDKDRAALESAGVDYKLFERTVH